LCAPMSSALNGDRPGNTRLAFRLRRALIKG
jgi:hypothetical protein